MQYPHNAIAALREDVLWGCAILKNLITAFIFVIKMFTRVAIHLFKSHLVYYSFITILFICSTPIYFLSPIAFKD